MDMKNLTQTQWEDLAKRVKDAGGVQVSQTVGDSTTAVMSQKAVTDQLKELNQAIGDFNNALSRLDSGDGV